MIWDGADVIIEIKCIVSEVHLNHPETILPTLPGPWKNCLPRIQKGWGPLARRWATENRVVWALLIACYSEAGLLSTKLCQGDGLEPEASQVTWQVRWSSISVPLWQDLMLSLFLYLSTIWLSVSLSHLAFSVPNQMDFQWLFFFWLHWVFVAVRGLPLVAVSRGYSLVEMLRLPLW